MTNYIRKTYDEFQIRQDCGFGFECVTTEATLREAKIQAKGYRDNQPEFPIKIKKVRIHKG